MLRLSHPRWILLLALALSAAGCTSFPSRPAAPIAMSAEDRAAHNLRTFDRAWQLVNDKFFDAKFRGVDWAATKGRYRPDAEKAADDPALYGVINAMLGELKESHNYAMSPQRRWEFLAKQQARVGLALQRVEGRWVVTEVLPNSPAEEAGVHPGWIVLRRDGKTLDETATFSLTEGQTVVYDFLAADDQPRSQAMVARTLSTAGRQEVRPLADGVVYLRFDGFDRKTLHWLSEQLKIHRFAPAVVIDLRNNYGGLFYSLEFSLGEFFPQAVPLGTVIRRSGSEKEKGSFQFFSARYAGKVVLLTGSATASCAEILAHALHFHGRATLVGRQTAGAVVASRYFSLPDGGMLQLAVEDFRGLDGQRLEGSGVKPDVVVPLKLADLRAGIDSDLAAAQARLHSLGIVARN